MVNNYLSMSFSFSFALVFAGRTNTKRLTTVGRSRQWRGSCSTSIHPFFIDVSLLSEMVAVCYVKSTNELTRPYTRVGIFLIRWFNERRGKGQKIK